MLEILMSVVQDGKLTLEKMSLGTIEEKYLNELSEYLIKRCGYAEYEEGKFSLHVIEEDRNEAGKTVFKDWVRQIEVVESKEPGSIRPENFDKVDLPIGDPWSNISNDAHRRVANGFWVASNYDGWK
jgi:hypothetical protein